MERLGLGYGQINQILPPIQDDRDGSGNFHFERNLGYRGGLR